MWCSVCHKAGVRSGLAGGTCSMRPGRITEHLNPKTKAGRDHTNALDDHDKQLAVHTLVQAAVIKQLQEIELFIISAMENVYWLAKEDIAQ